MNVPMPDMLCSIEGEAWLLRCKLLRQAFDQRDSGHYFRRSCEVEDAYRELSPAQFVERYA